MREAGLYLHIPFCQAKCHYCAFNSRPGSRARAEKYLQVLSSKIKADGRTPWSQEHSFSTIFVGGGTPTLVSAKALCHLLDLCFSVFAIASGAEISIEANPHSVSLADLELLRQAGYNRLSLGVQSFDDDLLTGLGRSHSSQQATAAYGMARQAGFTNINLDLIYGLPGQSLLQWQQSLETALALAPTHLALYELTIEEGTRFGTLAAEKKLSLPSEDELADMEELTRALLSSYHQYEISNYSLPGHECRHNVNYWHNGSYLGVGAGAVSFMAGQRINEEADPVRYMECVGRGESTSKEEESLSSKARFRETIIMGLRMVDGLDISALQQRFGLSLEDVYGSLCQELSEQGLLLLEDDRLRLPTAMLPLANQVLSQLV